MKISKSGLFIFLFLVVFSLANYIFQNPYQKIKRKELKEIAEREESPDELLNAIAEIKTGRNGQTYNIGNEIRELRKARERRAQLRTTGIALPWIERGPGNVSGRTRVVAVDPSDPARNTWFVGTIGGGVWKTTDAGTTWEDKTPGWPTLSVATMAIAESNPDIIYVGTGMGYGRIVDLAGSGIWKSTDHGETWTQLASTADGQLLAAINRIVVDPENPDIVLACSNGYFSHLGPNSTSQEPFGRSRKSGIFRSVDGGDTWTQVFDPDVAIGTTTDNRVQQIIADPTDFNILYATVNEVGVIKSIDKGLTWQVLDTRFFVNTSIGVPQENGFGLPGISARTELAIAPSDTRRIYAAIERPVGEPADLFMSRNSGETWHELTDTTGDPNWFEESGGLTRNAGWFDNTLVVNPFNENEVFVGGVNIYKVTVDQSAEQRQTIPNAWWRLNSADIPTLHADHHFTVTIPVDEATGKFRLVVGNDGGIGVSDNSGLEWKQIGGAGTSGLPTQPAGLNTTQFYGVDKKPGENVYIGGMQDNNSYISPADPDALSQWKLVTGGDGIEAVWNYSRPEYMLTTSQGERVYRSTDGGETFRYLPEANAGFGPFISKIGNSKSDPDLIFTIGIEGVKRSTDFGDNWSLTTIEGNWIGYRPFDNVEVSLANPQVVWITSRLDADPANGWLGGIHVSSDGGITFNEVSQNFPPEVLESSGLATHPGDPNTAYILFSAPNAPKILKTTDLGQTFEDISGFGTMGGRVNAIGFPDVAVFSLLVMPYDDQILWAGTEIGLFISEDGGASWTIADNGLPNAAIFQMSIVDHQILVATQGRGVWTVEIPELLTYFPPKITKAPGLKNLLMHPNGNYYFVADLRSPYDSTEVYINNQLVMTLPANTKASVQKISQIPTATEVVTVQLKSYFDGKVYKTAPEMLQVFPTEVKNSYIGRFEVDVEADNYLMDGISMGVDKDFSNSTAHTNHPYPNSTQFTMQIKTPIKVASSDAIMTYKDVALVEPGFTGDYNSAGFYDYVIVEGTKDGVNWLPLLFGYDARHNELWLNTFNTGYNGETSTSVASSEMFVKHTINLLDYFAAGDTIFVRFRMLSDPLVNGWGWAIDDVVIQDLLISDIEEQKVNNLKLIVYPNPVTDQTNIQYFLPERNSVLIRVVDLNGKVVSSAIYENEVKGFHTKKIPLGHLEKGIYLVVIETGKKTSSIRVVKQ